MNSVKSNMLNIWDTMKSGINERADNLRETVQNCMNSVKNSVNSIVNAATTWGKDLMQNLIDGIKSLLGDLEHAAENVAEAIKEYLHFSVPDVGPLTDYESWMPDFMKGLAKGINQSKKYVVSAVAGVADAMKMTLHSDLMYSMNGISGAVMDGSGSTTIINNYHNDNSRTVNQTNNNSVQAPVSINVTASGSDPEAVGRSVYDVAEQYLLRTIRGTISG